MLLGVITVIYIIVLALQVCIPYVVRETIVFGVTVPEQHVKHPSLQRAKKHYTRITGIVGITLLIIMLITNWTVAFSELTQSILLSCFLFAMIAVSMGMYWVNHQKVLNLKKHEQWGKNLKQVRAVDLTARNRDEMLPWPFFVAPMGVTAFIIAFTLFRYELMPENIAVHWGPTGAADDWVEKTYFTAILLPCVMLMMQCMMWGIADSIKRSAIKLSVNHKEESLESQLKIRKFASWSVMLLSYGLTIVLTVLQLSNIYPSLAEGEKLLPLLILFLVLELGGTLVFVWKLREWRLDYTENVTSEITDVDEDRYWRGGLIYINREDPSIFVEKRFGIGWTLNLGNPRGYIVIFLPLVILLLISIFSL
ncbi:hypothetical protein AEA09_19045 [Lysinibacillus contaminans]|uniref:DUF1648 domain-containing protein n=1 Tax=Lysinibacillus contaminans TaxID=1293441 RepID=A0ABR5JW03_9BACI|nr:DUF5808 domain-containing protein [Lysinibacillus contaminans]KOS66174.1 hypothetical protein AEA09_19045 [Lysinibacillus contaminans]